MSRLPKDQRKLMSYREAIEIVYLFHPKVKPEHESLLENFKVGIATLFLCHQEGVCDHHEHLLAKRRVEEALGSFVKEFTPKER